MFLAIFLQCLPNEVPEGLAIKAFERLMHNISPQARLERAAAETAKNAAINAIKSLFDQINTTPNNGKEQIILNDLKVIIDTDLSCDDFNKHVIDCYKKYRDFMNHQPYEHSAFFSPHNKIPIQDVFSKIFKILHITEADIVEDRVH